MSSEYVVRRAADAEELERDPRKRRYRYIEGGGGATAPMTAQSKFTWTPCLRCAFRMGRDTAHQTAHAIGVYCDPIRVRPTKGSSR